MVNTILLSLFVSAVTFLLTHFLKSGFDKKHEEELERRFEAKLDLLKSEIREAIETHEKIKHQEIVRTYVEEEINKHFERCPNSSALKDISSIKKGLYHLISGQGYDPISIMGD